MGEDDSQVVSIDRGGRMQVETEGYNAFWRNLIGDIEGAGTDLIMVESFQDPRARKSLDHELSTRHLLLFLKNFGGVFEKDETIDNVFSHIYDKYKLTKGTLVGTVFPGRLLNAPTSISLEGLKLLYENVLVLGSNVKVITGIDDIREHVMSDSTAIMKYRVETIDSGLDSLYESFALKPSS